MREGGGWKEVERGSEVKNRPKLYLLDKLVFAC